MSKKVQNNSYEKNDSCSRKKPVPKPDPNLRQQISKRKAENQRNNKNI